MVTLTPLKTLRETRRYYRVNSIKAIRYHINDVYNALKGYAKCVTKALALAREIKSFNISSSHLAEDENSGLQSSITAAKELADELEIN